MRALSAGWDNAASTSACALNLVEPSVTHHQRVHSKKWERVHWGCCHPAHLMGHSRDQRDWVWAMFPSILAVRKQKRTNKSYSLIVGSGCIDAVSSAQKTGTWLTNTSSMYSLFHVPRMPFLLSFTPLIQIHSFLQSTLSSMTVPGS